MFPINDGLKQGDSLSELPFNFVLQYATRWVQANQVGLKLNGTYQLLVYTDDVNLMLNIHTTKKAQALVITSEEIGLEVNADKLSTCCPKK
jgi:hypothetical protein